MGVDTGAIWWGEPGTNGQHSFYQLLHQGTSPVPADFIVFAQPVNPVGDHHDKLVANVLAQAHVLAFGKTAAEVAADGVAPDLVPHKVMPGDRPSTTLLLDRLTPRALGSLVALYEHSVLTQGVVWGVDSFDQWGVELGKAMAGRLLPALEADDVPDLSGRTPLRVAQGVEYGNSFAAQPQSVELLKKLGAKDIPCPGLCLNLVPEEKLPPEGGSK